MKYVNMLAKTASKLMFDLANLLDHPLFQLEGYKESYSLAEMAALREEVFHDFCALCLQSGLGIPPMERILLVSQAPNHDEKAVEAHQTRIKNFIEPVIFKIGQAKTSGVLSQEHLIMAFLEVFRNLPGLSTGRQVSAKQLECLINLMLVDQHINPVRPDYQTREVKTVTAAVAGLKRELKVLIVDDDQKALLKTARALAGWNSLQTLFYHYTSDKHSWNFKPEEKEAELDRAAREIRSAEPHIILMDQGLGAIDGSDLIGKIYERMGVDTPTFVANTDGSDEKLIAVGAFENCQKGKRLNGIVAAISEYSWKT